MKKNTAIMIRIYIFIVLILLIVVIRWLMPDKNETPTNSTEEVKIEIIEPQIEVKENYINKVTEGSVEPKFIIKLSDEDVWLLAKIAMAEAEGESIEVKALVICTVMNRVNNDHFPNTIEEVIFQCGRGVYQFSPVKEGGRWWTTEPNEECYKAVELVQSGWDESEGALYFESCQNKDNWHSRNLTFLFEKEATRFYK